MDFRHILVVCGITDQHKPAGNRLTQLFIDSQLFLGIDDFSMIRIKDVPHTIKDCNLVPNQEAGLGYIKQCKTKTLVWWEKYFQHHGLAIIAAAWAAEYLTSSAMQINIEYLSGVDIEVAHPGKVETGHKCTTWDVKWENYIGSMVGVSVIYLDYMTRHDMSIGWMAANEHDHLKYQAIHIGLAWEDNKMDVFTNLKACCLDDEGWSWIKFFDAQEDGRQTTANLREHYEGAGEVNKRVAWEMENIDNSHFASKHTYSFEKISTVLQDAFTILNNNGKSHSENQMVRKMLENVKLPNNLEMEACNRILLNTHGHNFANAVAYLYGQVTKIFPNAQI